MAGHDQNTAKPWVAEALSCQATWAAERFPGRKRSEKKGICDDPEDTADDSFRGICIIVVQVSLLPFQV